MRTALFPALLLSLLIIFISCEKKETPTPNPPVNEGTVSFRFLHMVDTVLLELDTFNYITMGGVVYKVTDLQYFISKITLYPHGAEPIVLSDGDSIRYVDLRIPETLEWLNASAVPSGQYDSVAFNFGLDESQNNSNRFPNPPERDMFWPEVLGGGYHHMKLNTMWKDCCTNLESPFMMHLGTGQIYSSIEPNIDSIISFVPNSFHVSLPQSSFTLAKDSTLTIDIVMHIDHWFNGPPNVLDLPGLPQGIMQNQELMQAIKENGSGAFTIND